MCMSTNAVSLARLMVVSTRRCQQEFLHLWKNAARKPYIIIFNGQDHFDSKRKRPWPMCIFCAWYSFSVIVTLVCIVIAFGKRIFLGVAFAQEKVAIWASRGQKSISLGLKQKWHQTIPCEAHCLSWKFETIWASGFGVMSAFLRAKSKPWCGRSRMRQSRVESAVEGSGKGSRRRNWQQKECSMRQESFEWQFWL